MPCNPALDGLRAAAIILVIAFHTDRLLVPDGQNGVDVSFTLSGYLITSIAPAPLNLLYSSNRSLVPVDLAGAIDSSGICALRPGSRKRLTIG